MGPLPSIPRPSTALGTHHQRQVCQIKIFAKQQKYFCKRKYICQTTKNIFVKQQKIFVTTTKIFVKEQKYFMTWKKYLGDPGPVDRL